MSHYFSDIKAGIITIINNSVKVKAVYNYEEVKPSGYPCITVTAADGDGEFADTSRNRREFIFSIKCYQERIEVGASEAERILINLIDELLGIFDSSANYNLNNTVIFAKPIPSKWGYLNVPDADVRTAEILIVGVAVQ